MTTSTTYMQKRAVKNAFLQADNTGYEILIFCPKCKTLEVICFSGQELILTRKFTKKADGVYHDCGSEKPCRLLRTTNPFSSI